MTTLAVNHTFFFTIIFNLIKLLHEYIVSNITNIEMGFWTFVGILILLIVVFYFVGWMFVIYQFSHIPGALADSAQSTTAKAVSAFTSIANKTGIGPEFGKIEGRSDMPETFANREPPQVWEAPMEFLDAVDQQGYGSYAEDLPRANMDAGIMESHREYIDETSHVGTTGASYAVVRDDFTPPVQFQGLPRHAMYAQLGSDQTARVTQSETPEQTLNYSRHITSGYVL